MSRTKATSTQLGQLVEYMKMNPDVASGRGTGLQGKVALEQQWKKLADTLNALGGPVKSVEKWKQTWRDLRNGVKKKALKNKREQKGDGPGGTGNGPSQIEGFSEQDEAVISVITPIAVYGMDGISCTVPAVDSELAEVVLHPPPVVVPPSPVVVLPPPEVVEPVPSAPLCSTPRLSTPISSTIQLNAPKRVRSRHRQTSRIESFDSQILNTEKERIELKKKLIELKERYLLIEEAKVAAFQRIATALENNQNLSNKNH